MNIQYRFWLKLSIFNLLTVALLGALMRYKIGFEFPFLEQKFIQHAHSHFAFSAWITQTIYILMIRFVTANSGRAVSGQYRILLMINTACSWGMLIAFLIQGYGLFSIALSTASILTGWAFAAVYLKDLKGVPQQHPALPWLRAAHFFNIISSLGTFVLAYMSATHHISQKVYLASVYYYLHFQYNGWFFFACAGILIARLHNAVPGFLISRNTYRLFAWSCIPAFMLSTLWLNFPVWLNILIALAAAAQVLGWAGMLKPLSAAFKSPQSTLPSYSKILFGLAALSLSIKLLLQLASCIPYVSQLAFGFRPIVIAYLHLVLLAVFTLFLVTYMHSFIQTERTRLNRNALLVFVAGIFLNELVLGIQGIASFSYTLIPRVNETLFAISLLMLGALLGLFLSLRRINFRQTDRTDG